MKTELLEVFKNVNDWLKFAEAKNALLIGFNGALIFGIVRLKDFTLVGSGFLNVYSNIVLVILILSIVLSLLSFVPRIKMVKAFMGEGKHQNLWFFEYLKTLSSLQIARQIGGYEDSETPARIDLDLAEQIRQNSIIASRKYAFFAIAVWLTLAAFLSPLVAGILWLYSYINQA